MAPALNDTFDFNSPSVPESVRQHKPMLFPDGSGYCCILGEDPQKGIFGCGKNPEEAMKDWDKDYQSGLLKDPTQLSILLSKNHSYDWLNNKI